MADELGIPGWTLTGHAIDELSIRRIAIESVRAVLTRPGQRIPVRPGREVWQAVLLLGESPSPYLIRVVVDIDRHPHEVVTAYRTSKIGKYWRQG